MIQKKKDYFDLVNFMHDSFTWNYNEASFWVTGLNQPLKDWLLCTVGEWREISWGIDKPLTYISDAGEINPKTIFLSLVFVNDII